MDRNQYLNEELMPGMTVFLDPSQFPTQATRWMCGTPSMHPVQDPHYFVIVGRIRSMLALAPAFSEPKWYRNQIVGKTGHDGWKNHPTNFDACQILTASAEAVIGSAAHAGDLSVRGDRNGVTDDELAAMLEAIRRHAAGEDPPPGSRAQLVS